MILTVLIPTLNHFCGKPLSRKTNFQPQYWETLGAHGRLFSLRSMPPVCDKKDIRSKPVNGPVMQRRNIILITIDSLRADHLSCYGYDRATTPNLDALADNGIKFTNAFAHSGTTRTSFPAILTSTYALMYGGYERISDKRTIVSEPLRRENYRTAGFHSNLFLAAEFGYSRGFETFYDSKTDPSLTAKLRQIAKHRLKSDSYLLRFLQWAFNATEKHGGVEIGSAYVNANDITDRTLDWLDTVDSSFPVFLWIHYMDVHHPYVPPNEHQEPFRESPISNRRATKLRRKMLDRPSEVTDVEYQQLIDLYDAEIRLVDTQVGRLITEIREHLGDKSIIIVTADHGEEFGEHGNFSHNTVHDEGIHVPLIVYDGQNDGTFNELVGLLDVAPTILNYANVPKPDSYCGFGIQRLVETGEWERTAVIGNWGEPTPGQRQFFYRDKNWKYIQRTEVEELYDLHQDPCEQQNVIYQHPTVHRRLQRIIEDHDDAVQKTHVHLGDVEMDTTVKDRLEKLGYLDQ